MRSCVTSALAVLLILAGCILAWLVVVRVGQENGAFNFSFMAGAQSGAQSGATAAAGSSAGSEQAGAKGQASGQASSQDLGQSAQAGLQLSLESGAMPLMQSTPGAAAVTPVAVVAAVPRDAGAPTPIATTAGITAAAPAQPAPPQAAAPAAAPQPLATVDPCAPVPTPGYPSGATVYAIGMLRLYSAPDVLAPTIGEFSAGQGLLVSGDINGVTAVRRCDMKWVRVIDANGAIGWVLDEAVTDRPITPTPTRSPCPGGCATPVPPCGPVCPTPTTCWQPCYQQPCQQDCQEIPGGS